MGKIGRNDKCHCGSGKKYKNCHENNDGYVESKNRGKIIGSILVIFIILFAIGAYVNSQSSENRTPAPGKAPEGKVWSAEHGHWHDAPSK